MTTEDERRRAPRAPIADTLFVKSVSSSQINMMEAAECNTINASSTGLQVELDFEVLVSAEIALWISSENGARTLVSGTIRWTRPTERDSFLVGIELDAESGPSISDWLNNIH